MQNNAIANTNYCLWLTRMELRNKIVARLIRLPAATACWLVKKDVTNNYIFRSRHIATYYVKYLCFSINSIKYLFFCKTKKKKYIQAWFLCFNLTNEVAGKPTIILDKLKCHKCTSSLIEFSLLYMQIQYFLNAETALMVKMLKITILFKLLDKKSQPR